MASDQVLDSTDRPVSGWRTCLLKPPPRLPSARPPPARPIPTYGCSPPRRARLHRGQPPRPAAHGDVQRQRRHHDRRGSRFVRPGRGRHRDRAGRDRRGRPLDGPPRRPVRPGQDRGARHGRRRTRLAGPGALRAPRRTGLDTLRRLRRDGHHPEHGRHVAGPLGPSAPGRPGGPAHRQLLRTGRRRAVLHARPGPRRVPVRGPLPRGGHPHRRDPADDRCPGLRRAASHRATGDPRHPGPLTSAHPGHGRPARRVSRDRGRLRRDGGRLHRARGGAILALQATGSCVAGLLYGSLPPPPVPGAGCCSA